MEDTKVDKALRDELRVQQGSLAALHAHHVDGGTGLHHPTGTGHGLAYSVRDNREHYSDAFHFLDMKVVRHIVVFLFVCFPMIQVQRRKIVLGQHLGTAGV